MNFVELRKQRLESLGLDLCNKLKERIEQGCKMSLEQFPYYKSFYIFAANRMEAFVDVDDDLVVLVDTSDLRLNNDRIVFEVVRSMTQDGGFLTGCEVKESGRHVLVTVCGYDK